MAKIRTIYLYIFAMLGLVLLTIGGVGFADMLLKATIFTGADAQERIYALQPPAPHALGGTDLSNLSESDQAAIDRWKADYKNWEERTEDYDPVNSRRQRSAAQNLALMLIGLPLYLFHWNTIKKEK